MTRSRSVRAGLPVLLVLMIVSVATLSGTACRSGARTRTPRITSSSPDLSPLPAEIIGVTWRWDEVTNGGSATPINVEEPYTLTFNTDGHVAIQADCNRGTGPYAATQDRHLTIGPLRLTRAMCPSRSMWVEFVRDVSRTSSYSIRGSDLALELASGRTLRFVRTRAGSVFP
jgi:heat shock protein HslJ